MWCGVVWCGVVWCGVVWCGVVWCGVVWYSLDSRNVFMFVHACVPAAGTNICMCVCMCICDILAVFMLCAGIRIYAHTYIFTGTWWGAFSSKCRFGSCTPAADD